MTYTNWYKLKLLSLGLLILIIIGLSTYSYIIKDEFWFLVSFMIFVGGTIPMMVVELWFINDNNHKIKKTINSKNCDVE